MSKKQEKLKVCYYANDIIEDLDNVIIDCLKSKGYKYDGSGYSLVEQYRDLYFYK